MISQDHTARICHHEQIHACQDMFVKHVTSLFETYIEHENVLYNNVSYKNVIQQCVIQYMVRCAIWYHLHDFKNVKNIHGGVLILVKLKPATLLNLTFLHECFSRFLNCANGTKLHNASHIFN